MGVYRWFAGRTIRAYPSTENTLPNPSPENGEGDFVLGLPNFEGLAKLGPLPKTRKQRPFNAPYKTNC